MRKVLVVVIATATLALAGALVAAPKASNQGHHAAAAVGLDIFEMSQRAGGMPDQSYPAH